MNCPECGAEIAEGAVHCEQCGASLEAEGGVKQGQAGKSTLKARLYELRWLIAAYVIASACCMSAACLLGYRTQWILWKLGLR